MAAHARAGEREHRVAWFEHRDSGADGLDHTRQLGAEDRLSRRRKSKDHTTHPTKAPRQHKRPHAPITRCDRGGVHADQHLVVLGNGHRHVSQLDDVRRTVTAVDGGFHGAVHATRGAARRCW